MVQRTGQLRKPVWGSALPRSGVSVLTPIGTGVTEIAKLVHERVELVCNYRMEMDQCCPVSTQMACVGWPHREG